MRGDAEVKFIVHDAMRRLEYNLHELLNAQDQQVDTKSRTKNQIRIFAYANFLSSMYSLQDVMKAYFKHIDCKKDFTDKVESALDNDELMNYVRNSRNTQDHSLKPAAFRPILEHRVSISLQEEVVRGNPELRELKVNYGTKTIPVPKLFLGRPIGDATLEVVAQRAYDWWAMVMNGLDDETFSVPEPHKS